MFLFYSLPMFAGTDLGSSHSLHLDSQDLLTGQDHLPSYRRCKFRNNQAPKCSETCSKDMEIYCNCYLGFAVHCAFVPVRIER